MVRLAATILFVGIAAASCPAAEKKAAEKPAYAGVIAAVVNGVLITEHEVTAPYADKVVKEKDRARLRKIMLSRRIYEEVLYQEAKRMRVSVPRGLLQRDIDRQVRESGGLLAFVRNLRQQRSSYAQYKNERARELAIQIYMQRFMQGHSKRKFTAQGMRDLLVTPADVRAYYEDNPDQFRREKEGRARVIAFYIEFFESSEAAEAQAGKVLSEVRSGGDFEALARKHSGVRREKGGLFLLSGDAGLRPELARKLSGLAEGQTSEVFRQGKAYYIVKLEEKKCSQSIPLDKVVERIKKKLRERALHKERQLLINRLLAKASILPVGIFEGFLRDE
jgi:parvulin-like peptidyl-prolyl isomerase